ncbi:MAG: sugar transferase [Epsilonproteobacteria bacterium]|nr:sugar transferase [Campylobacterota bacterium]
MSNFKAVASEVVPNAIVISKNIKGYTFLQYFMKKILEFFIVFFLLIVTLPIVIYTIYRIKKDSKGSVFFIQQRVGLNGKPFSCYKFRSMHEDSAFNPYTQDNDERIFQFGHTMRKLRIDELPQLWNVIKGDMDLIGPRAEWDILVEDYAKKIPSYHKRHLVKPGITGLAQVCYPYGRNLEDAKSKLSYDLLYIKTWSLLLELKIAWLTVMVILDRKGV